MSCNNRFKLQQLFNDSILRNVFEKEVESLAKVQAKNSRRKKEEYNLFERQRVNLEKQWKNLILNFNIKDYFVAIFLKKSSPIRKICKNCNMQKYSQYIIFDHPVQWNNNKAMVTLHVSSWSAVYIYSTIVVQNRW